MCQNIESSNWSWLVGDSRLEGLLFYLSPSPLSWGVVGLGKLEKCRLEDTKEFCNLIVPPQFRDRLADVLCPLACLLGPPLNLPILNAIFNRFSRAQVAGHLHNLLARSILSSFLFALSLDSPNSLAHLLAG